MFVLGDSFLFSKTIVNFSFFLIVTYGVFFLRLVLAKQSLEYSWCWPTNGKVVNYFSVSEGGNKGIDIIGFMGQPILAANNGYVVYAGDLLRGYGNLIVIKHGSDYLTAYAHNDKILVKIQQRVKIGQKIATMGDSGTDSIKLHFEIRYKGKSVDPLYYLSR